MTTRPGARELIAALLDDGSFLSWDEPIDIPAGTTPEYAEELARARARAGTDEAVLTGEGTVRGRPVAVIVSEFRFMAGSVGVACANRIESAVRRATAKRLPLLAAPASGGIRMQEGTPAFLQMVRITAAIVDHKNAGLAYLVYLRHPSTGGVVASWGSLGQLTVAEPGALIGLLGPKVVHALHGEQFPEGVQVAENLARRGVIDGVVAPDDLADVVARTLGILTAGPDPAPVRKRAPLRGATTWECIERSRDPRRPGVRRVLGEAAAGWVPLSGTAEGEHAPGVLIALARIAGVSCLVVGQDRDAQRRRGPIGPQDLRRVRRGIRLARQLRLPLVTVVDTPGASLSPEAEEGGLAGEIAGCLGDLLELESPTVCVLLGEGAGGAALTLVPADRVVAAEHAWLAPLPPEAASAILHRGDVSFAAPLAERQGVAATSLAARRVVDVLVGEGSSTPAFAAELCAVVAEQILIAAAMPWPVRARRRADRYLAAA